MASFELAQWLPVQQRRVEVLLTECVERVTRDVPPALTEAMRYSLLGGGKRLRPVFCLTFADAVAGQSRGGGQLAEDAACALELIHTYSLIHDDLPAMDDDELRRGRPTSHKVFGEALAILAGDALLTAAFELVLGDGVADAAARTRLGGELAKAAGAAGMVGGQVLDIAADRPATLPYLQRLHAKKTGALIRVACRLGVIAARGDEVALRAADAFGAAVGLAFQITDDVLDVTASPDAMGKPTKADEAKGRFTFPAVVGLDQAKAMASELATSAVEAVRALEPEPGPLAALARLAVEREQ